MISKKELLPTIDADANLDDSLTEIHSIYQNVKYTEESIETFCAEAKKLMKLISPEKLVETSKPQLDPT